MIGRAAGEGSMIFLHISPLELRLRQRLMDCCADAMKQLAVVRQKTIYAPGDNDRAIYFLERGLIRVGQTSAAGKEVIFEIVRPGQLFGETVFIGGGVRSAEARALEDSECLSLPLTRVRQALATDSGLAEDFLEFLSRRIVETHQRVADLAFYTNPCRLAKILLEEARSRGTRFDGALRVRLGLTHEQLAQMIGTSREIVTSILNTFRQLAVLDYERSSFTIFPEKLERYFNRTCINSCNISVKDSHAPLVDIDPLHLRQAVDPLPDE